MNGKNPKPRPYSPKKHDEGYSKIDWSKKSKNIGQQQHELHKRRLRDIK